MGFGSWLEDKADDVWHHAKAHPIETAFTAAMFIPTPVGLGLRGAMAARAGYGAWKAGQFARAARAGKIPVAKGTDLILHSSSPKFVLNPNLPKSAYSRAATGARGGAVAVGGAIDSVTGFPILTKFAPWATKGAGKVAVSKGLRRFGAAGLAGSLLFNALTDDEGDGKKPKKENPYAGAATIGAAAPGQSLTAGQAGSPWGAGQLEQMSQAQINALVEAQLRPQLLALEHQLENSRAQMAGSQDQNAGIYNWLSGEFRTSAAQNRKLDRANQRSLAQDTRASEAALRAADAGATADLGIGLGGGYAAESGAEAKNLQAAARAQGTANKDYAQAMAAANDINANQMGDAAAMQRGENNLQAQRQYEADARLVAQKRAEVEASRGALAYQLKQQYTQDQLDQTMKQIQMLGALQELGLGGGGGAKQWAEVGQTVRELVNPQQKVVELKDASGNKYPSLESINNTGFNDPKTVKDWNASLPQLVQSIVVKHPWLANDPEGIKKALAGNYPYFASWSKKAEDHGLTFIADERGIGFYRSK